MNAGTAIDIINDPAVLERAAAALQTHEVIRQPGNPRLGVQTYHWCERCGVLDSRDVAHHTVRFVLAAAFERGGG